MWRPPESAYGERMPSLRPRVAAPLLTVAVLGAMTLTGAAGCVNLQRNTLHDGELLAGPVSAVQVSGGSGDIDVRVDESVDGVDIQRTVRYAHTEPGKTTRLDGGTLVLESSCGELCSVSYDVRASSRLTVKGGNGSGNLSLHGVSDVDLTVGSGDIEVTGATGRVSTRTGSGNVVLVDLTGDVSVTTGSGDVEGRGLRGPRTVIEVSSGNVVLDVPGTGDVTVRAASGDVEVSVPDRTCRVTVDTHSGEQDIRVASVADAQHTLDLHTTSGNVTVKPSGLA
jgi:Toastrack DUF4097